MQIQENISLRPYNTFGIDANARYFARFSGVEELEELLEFAGAQGKKTTAPLPLLVLGGGSNILLTRDVDGLVLKNEIGGITEMHEDEEYVYIRSGAGETWHRFVLHCIARNWAGIENLSLIPGSVGATPIQNIGAYGVEIDDVFWSLEAWHIRERKRVTFTRSDCAFGYRDSIFKNKYKGQFVILSVTYRLRKKPRFNTAYGAIEQELQRMGVQELSIKAVSDAVIHIRSSKLPDPEKTGNAGSFFKNPEIDAAQFAGLKEKFPGIIGYSLPGEKVKLAAGWLIEQSGWKGYRKGDAGCHPAQALVLVNYGQATGRQILELAGAIAASVQERFGVALEREVNVV